MPEARHPTVTRLPVRPAKVSGLGDLAAVVPYLLGFVPHESVTCVSLRDRQVGLTARVDLAGVLDPEAAPVLLDSVFEAIARTEATGVIAIVSSELLSLDPVVVRRVQLAADRAGLHLLDVGWHRGDRCVSLLCDDPRCCPPAVAVVDTACAAATSATFAGVAPLPDREAVEAEFDRPVGVDPEALDALIAEHETTRMRDVVAGDTAASTRAADLVLDLARAHDARALAGRAAQWLTDEQAAACVAALADTGVRDAVWLAVDSRAVHGQGLWLELARRAPSPYDASPLFLLGWRSWRHGDGVRAVIAAEKAAATPGGYSAAGLLLQAIGACVDPRSVPGLSA